MKSVILAGGKGTRMGLLARDIPKHLINVRGKPILCRILESLPRETDGAVLVIRHFGEKIKDYFGGSFNGIPLEYVLQDEKMPGTGGALWSAKDIVRGGKFLVLNGDDIYVPGFLGMMAEEDLAFGVTEREWDRYFSVETDENGNLSDLVEKSGKKLVSTGAYTLDGRIFEYEPVLAKSGEYVLPRTVLKMAKDYPIKLVRASSFVSINTPEDLKIAESIISE
jgi:bifunctional UDP-N-acetylglucosamine pyrophosphorylase/glucosamine-1-phosphate N-acetyltransferase